MFFYPTRVPRRAAYFSGSTALYIDKAVATTLPVTMSCWFNGDSASAGGHMISIADSSASAAYLALIAAGDIGGDPIRAIHRNVSIGAAISTTGYTVGQWHHACGVFATTTDRRAYIDGGSKGTNSTSISVPTMDRTGIAVLARSAFDAKFPGALVDVCIWRAALSDYEVWRLSRGVPPSEIRKGSLVCWLPLIDPHSTRFRDWSGRRHSFIRSGTVTWDTKSGAPPQPTLGYLENGTLLNRRLDDLGQIWFFSTVLGGGVVSNSFNGTTLDENGNLRVSGQVYEGAP
jgi:hypothetical protein